MPFAIVRNDITKMDTDAIVNAANSGLSPGGGVCGAIFSAAGYETLDKACRAIGHCDVGGAVITRGFALPTKYVIHAVGPIWQGGGHNEAVLLKSAYISALELARKKGCRSIAFPLISSGIYGYPKAEALHIAVEAISGFLLEHEMDVLLVIFDKSAVVLSQQLLGKVQSYIDDHYVDAFPRNRRFSEAAIHHQQLKEQENIVFSAAPPPPVCASCTPSATPVKQKRSLDELLGRLDESFSKMLLRLIDERGMKDSEVYKRANIDRKLFSKLRKDGYNPSKPTAIALAISLQLNLDQTRDLLAKAGYALSHSSKFDVIIEYFIVEGNYNIHEINEVLFAFDQRLLGA